MENINSYPTKMSPLGFWSAVNVWITKPHVLNKRLWGTKLLHTFLTNVVDETVNEQHWQKLMEWPTNVEDKHVVLEAIKERLHLVEAKSTDDSSIEIKVLKLLPKMHTDYAIYQLVVLVKDEFKAIFLDLTPQNLKQSSCPNFTYTLQLVNNTFVIKSYCDPETKSLTWLLKTAAPHLLKWGEEDLDDSTKSSFSSGSLTLVPIEKYYLKYNELKLKYGKKMVQIWPECTDPSKYVYEDVAIATYLLVLWEEEREKLATNKMQSFVDLGCGNGLLVYILASEGHPGYGIDVRKRNIWDMYPKEVLLQERTITPSDINLFPETDWLIGNHSDELTPWIPVVASRSSYECKFFLLPCCCFNFNGSKYQRRDSSKSQYSEFLEYVKEICDVCGISTSIDRLKIPSTKRICLVGKSRTYAKEEFSINCEKIQKYINIDSIVPTSEAVDNKDWIRDFKARESIERVKNCTRIDKSLIDTIVKLISEYLVGDCATEGTWEKGKVVELEQVVKLVPKDLLKSLKSECGGLQTLLKNNHHIFKVEFGKVQLRYPLTVDDVKTKVKKRKASNMPQNVKKKPCWFFANHPQGCPLTNDQCSFIHIDSTC